MSLKKQKFGSKIIFQFQFFRQNLEIWPKPRLGVRWQISAEFVLFTRTTHTMLGHRFTGFIICKPKMKPDKNIIRVCTVNLFLLAKN